MSDEKRRKRERDAQAEGGTAALAGAHADRRRSGHGIAGFLDELIGQTIYVEGVRINYRGTLREVLYHADGMPAGLVMNPCQRVSYFQQTGPNTAYTYTHTEPRLVPYEVVHDVGLEGFAGGKWPAIK